MTTKQYLASRDLAAAATLTQVGDDGRPFVQLDHTLFHPQGGGQKADRGTIAGRAVTHVAKVGNEVNHYLESTAGLVAGDVVPIEVDAGCRSAASAWHTGGHLIAALVEHGWPTLRATNGHHWPGEARVEFSPAAAALADAIAAGLPGLLAAAVAGALPVAVVGDPFASRAVAIGAFPPVPCGGTHVRHTGELPRIVVSKVRPKDGRLRVSYTLEG